MDRTRNQIDRRFCVAPMMRYSHGPARRLWRRLCPGGMVYTEMITAAAVLRGDADRLLAFSADERPLGLQLGGSDPAALARCAEIAERRGYDEVNLNAGCPSGRVLNGGFGACLMRRPRLVADCVRAMRDACSLPVTVKTRIAVDELDPEECLDRMAGHLADAGVDALVVHARKAWTEGLDPKANRTVPPLDHARVRRLKRSFPGLEVIANGGIDSAAEIEEHLRHVDGVMCGREVARNPMLLAQVARGVFGLPCAPGREEAAQIAIRIALELPPRQWRLAVSSMMGLFRGMPNGRLYRKVVCEAGDAARAARALAAHGFA